MGGRRGSTGSAPRHPTTRRRFPRCKLIRDARSVTCAPSPGGEPTRSWKIRSPTSQSSTAAFPSPQRCTPRLAHSARDAAPADGGASRWPLLLFSHCTECFRFSMHSLAERLASRGFVVAAPDHLDNTRYDATAPLTNAFLAVRADD